MKEKCKYLFYWFAFGLGYQLQFIASLSLSEAVALLVAPFLMGKEIQRMRKSGVLPLFGWSLVLIAGCVLACLANHCTGWQILRGMATVSIITCLIVVFHRLVWCSPNGMRWFFVGVLLCLVINTFVFRRNGDMMMYGDDLNSIVNGALYWVIRVNNLVSLPIKGWYLQTPWLYSSVAPFGIGVFAMLASTSGRSSALGVFASGLFIIMGGKKTKRMKLIAKNFYLIVLVFFLLAPLTYTGYKALAGGGYLGEKAQAKFESQTRGGDNIASLFVGGRAGSFAGFYSCIEQPIVGWGPWALDWAGNNAKFIYKYGSYEDIRDLEWRKSQRAKLGLIGAGLIATHSTIEQFWVWFGAAGLFCSLYWAFVLLRFLRQDLAAVPQWFGWTMMLIPPFFWDFFFSPYSDRIIYTLLLVACLYARGVRQGRVGLPLYMLNELRRRS